MIDGFLKLVTLIQMDPFCVNHLNTMFQKYLKLPFVKGFSVPGFYFVICGISAMTSIFQ